MNNRVHVRFPSPMCAYSQSAQSPTHRALVPPALNSSGLLPPICAARIERSGLPRPPLERSRASFVSGGFSAHVLVLLRIDHRRPTKEVDVPPAHWAIISSSNLNGCKQNAGKQAFWIMSSRRLCHFPHANGFLIAIPRSLRKRSPADYADRRR